VLVNTASLQQRCNGTGVALASHTRQHKGLRVGTEMTNARNAAR